MQFGTSIATAKTAWKLYAISYFSRDYVYELDRSSYFININTDKIEIRYTLVIV